jgi:hypothetical protein
MLQCRDQWRPTTGRYGRRSAAMAIQALPVRPRSLARCRAPSSALTLTVALYIARVHRGIVFLSLFFHRRRLAPPLAVAAIEPPPAMQIASSCSPRPHASSGSPELAFFPPKSSCHPFLPRVRSEHRHHRPHVARPLQFVSVITKSTIVIAVSP